MPIKPTSINASSTTSSTTGGSSASSSISIERPIDWNKLDVDQAWSTFLALERAELLTISDCDACCMALENAKRNGLCGGLCSSADLGVIEKHILTIKVIKKQKSSYFVQNPFSYFQFQLFFVQIFDLIYHVFTNRK